MRTYELPEDMTLELRLHPRDDDGEPDYDAHYPKLSLGLGEDRTALMWELTPAMARRLAGACCEMVALLSDPDGQPERVATEVLGPRVVAACREHRECDPEDVLAKFAAIADQTRARIQCGEVPWPRCVADEIVLRAAAERVAASGAELREVVDLADLRGAPVDDPFATIADTTWSEREPPARWFRRYLDGQQVDLGLRR